MPIRPVNAFANFLGGRRARMEDDAYATRARQEEETQARRNTLADLEIENARQFNTLSRDPGTTPEQFARAGRSDIGNSLTNIGNSRQEALGRLGAVAQRALQLDPVTRREFARRAMTTHSEEFRAIGADPSQMGNFDSVPDDQLEQALRRIAVYGPEQPAKLETVGDLKNPTAGIYQRDPKTGEIRQVTAPQRADSGQAPPAGYRWTKEGLAPIKGGPADPEGPAARKVAAPLRKEFRTLESVKSLETSLPLLKSAEKAPDTGYGDLQLIYTAGKILDPGSVVREGELALTVAAGSPLQRVIGKTRFTLEKGGRLTPVVRQQIMEMLNERVGAYQQAYDQDREVYAQYATDAGLDPMVIVGKHPTDAYGRPQKPTAVPSQEITATGPNGEKIVLRNGKWVALGQ